MSDFLFKCPSCTKSLVVADTSVGQSFQCPSCGNPVTIQEPNIEISCPSCSSDFLILSEGGESFNCPECDVDMEIPLIKPAMSQRLSTNSAQKKPLTLANTSKPPEESYLSDVIIAGRFAPQPQQAKKSFNMMSLISSALSILLLAGIVWGLLHFLRSDAANNFTLDDLGKNYSDHMEETVELAEEIAETESAPESRPNVMSRESTVSEVDTEILTDSIAKPEREPDPAQKMQIDAFIRDKFNLDFSEPPIMLMTLNDGSKLVCHDVEDVDDGYSCRVSQNENRSIALKKIIPKASVASMIAEGNDEVLWTHINSEGLLTTVSYCYYHEKVIENVLDHFIATYKDSPHVQQVTEIKNQWGEELTKLRNGWQKADGQWYGPDETPPPKLPAPTLQCIMEIRGFMASGKYTQAIPLCKSVNISDEFPAEQEAFRGIINQLITYIENDIQSQRDALTRKIQNADNTYKNTLANIASWQTKRFTSVKTSNESEYHYQQKRASMQAEVNRELANRQAAARSQLEGKYQTTKQKLEADIRALELTLQRYRDELTQHPLIANSNAAMTTRNRR